MAESCLWRRPSSKSEGIQGVFPFSLLSHPAVLLCSPDASTVAKSRLFQHINGRDSGSDKGQRMEAPREAFVSPSRRPL